MIQSWGHGGEGSCRVARAHTDFSILRALLALFSRCNTTTATVTTGTLTCWFTASSGNSNSPIARLPRSYTFVRTLSFDRPRAVSVASSSGLQAPRSLREEKKKRAIIFPKERASHRLRQPALPPPHRHLPPPPSIALSHHHPIRLVCCARGKQSSSLAVQEHLYSISGDNLRKPFCSLSVPRARPAPSGLDLPLPPGPQPEPDLRRRRRRRQRKTRLRRARQPKKKLPSHGYLFAAPARCTRQFPRSTGGVAGRLHESQAQGELEHRREGDAYIRAFSVRARAFAVWAGFRQEGQDGGLQDGRESVAPVVLDEPKELRTADQYSRSQVLPPFPRMAVRGGS